MRVIHSILAGCAICALTSMPALAQAGGKMSKMSDSTAKHAMTKKGDGMAKRGGAMSAMKDTAAPKMSKGAMKSGKKGAMKHDGMAMDSSKAMKKPQL